MSEPNETTEPTDGQQAEGAAPSQEQTTEQAPQSAEAEDMQRRVIEALRGVFDPEIPVNIHDLGLIYKVDCNPDNGRVSVLMTLTTPNCPEAQSMPGRVEQAVQSVEDVKESNVEIVWDPPWTPEKMSDEAKFQLGFM